MAVAEPPQIRHKRKKYNTNAKIPAADDWIGSGDRLL